MLVLIVSVLDGKEGTFSPSLESTSSELSTSTSGIKTQKYYFFALSMCMMKYLLV